MHSQLREAAFRICSEEEVIGAMGLINHLSKACFVQGLINERVQTIVRAKGETALLSTCIDCALEEESAIMSAKERSFSAQKVNRGLEVAGSMRGNPCVNMFNPLKTNGNCTYQMKISHSAFCIYGFRMILDLNGDYILKRH
jgi:hypothetical protein